LSYKCYNRFTKTFIRAYTFSFISAYITQQLVGGFAHPAIFGSPFVLFVLALAAVEIFIIPIFKLLSLPVNGPGGIILRALLVGLTMYVCATVIEGFTIVSATLPAVTAFGVYLPSKYLGPWESLGASALSYSIIRGVFDWLTSKK